MGVISSNDSRIVSDGYIHCFSCVKSCPVGAKYFDNEMLTKITTMLESKFTSPKEPEIFIILKFHINP